MANKTKNKIKQNQKGNKNKAKDKNSKDNQTKPNSSEMEEPSTLKNDESQVGKQSSGEDIQKQSVQVSKGKGDTKTTKNTKQNNQNSVENTYKPFRIQKMYNCQSGSSNSTGQELSQYKKDISVLKAQAVKQATNETYYDNFYVSSQDEEHEDNRSCGAKSYSDGSDFNLSKFSHNHCVFGQDKISFAKKVRRSNSYNSRSSQNEKASHISFESQSSDQENVEIFKSYTEDIDFMETIYLKQHVVVPNAVVKVDYEPQTQQEISLNNTLKTFESQLNQYQESSEQIKKLMAVIQTFKADKQKLHDNLAHCLFCIYNQQDITHYFAEMMLITDLMKQHFKESTDPDLFKGMELKLNQNGVTAQLKTQIQAQTSPQFIKQIVTDIIGDIMKNIRKQILQKMMLLDVIVKEPLYRRASFDDYQLCFENFNKKTGYGESLAQVNAFGYGFQGNYGVFTNNGERKTKTHLMKQSGDEFDLSTSSQYSHRSSELQAQIKTQAGIDLKDDAAKNNISYIGSINIAYRQQQEMYMDNTKNYEYIRTEGRQATWNDIKQSRRRLQKFVNRPSEYKKVFDMILRSYVQLRDSLEYLEEFWVHLIEQIYGKIQTGKLQFDRIWKDLFHDKIMENKHIKYFLNDVSDQYESQYQKQEKSQNKLILEEIYQNLVKLETDLNQEQVIENLINLQNFIDFSNEGQPDEKLDETSFEQSQIDQVILHQYDLIGAKMRLKYGGKSLAQIINSCEQMNPDNILKVVKKQSQLTNSILFSPNTEQNNLPIAKKKNKDKSSNKKQEKIEVPQINPNKLMLNKPAKQQPGIKFSKDTKSNYDPKDTEELDDEIQKENDSLKKQEKKKKLNQRKKKQRLEKKKRQNQLNQLQQQKEQLLMYQDLEDQQLLELIYRYDCNMSIADQEYLMQVPNRDEVVRTLQAKLIERDQMYDDEYGDEDYPHTQISDAELHEDDRQRLGLVHKNLEMQYRNDLDYNSDSSYEEQIYDDEFEKELKDFERKLQPSIQDGCSTNTGSQKKLVPNVTSQWIDSLREQLKITNYLPTLVQNSKEELNKDENFILQKRTVQQNPLFAQCMTTSTAGMSFNSPPATARDCEYDQPAHGGDIVDNYSVTYSTMDKIDSLNKKNMLVKSNSKQRNTNSQTGTNQQPNAQQDQSKQTLSMKMQQQSA